MMTWTSNEHNIHKLIYSVSLVVINLLATILNGTFIILFIRFRQKLLTTNNTKLLLSMAVADFFVGATGLTTGVLFLTKQPMNIYKLLGTLPLFSCMYTSIISLGVMTLDRLISIKCALRYHSLMSSRLIHRVIALSWIVPLTLTLSCIIMYEYTNHLLELKFRNILLAICFTFGLTILLISSRILYSCIREQHQKLRSLLVSYKRVSTDVTVIPDMQGNSQRRKETSNDICLSSMCFWVVNAFIICWLPLTVYRLTYLFGRRPVLYLGRLSMCLATFNSVLNPCIYIIKRSAFRKCIKHLFELAGRTKDKVILKEKTSPREEFHLDNISS